MPSGKDGGMEIYMKFKRCQIIGIIFTIGLGSLLHFTYEWSGNNPIVGIFSAVNESTWEHLKLLFMPMFFYGIYEYFIYGKDFKNFIPVRFLSILVGMLFIVITFYGYTFILGKNVLILDISIFFLGVIAAYFFSYKLIPTDIFSSKIENILSIAGLIILCYCMVKFTFNPPAGLLFDI